MVAWAVWNHRNSLKFSHPIVAVDCISSKASAMLQEFLSVQASLVTAPTTAALHQWRPLEYPFFKANFDAAIFKTRSLAGISVIIRDGMGEAIGALTMPIPLANSVATMEALACHMAVLFAKEIGLSDMIFEGDSVEVIQAITQENSDHPDFGHIIDIRILASDLNSFQLSCET